MSLLSQRRPRRLALLTASTVAGAGLALAPTATQAVETGTVTGGSAVWGLSTYLNSANFGRPNPLASAYEAPASFDAESRLTTYGGATGEVAADGSADLVFDGMSVNFAGTGGGWLRISEVQADLDAAGNGALSAVVAYGTSVTGMPPAMQYDPEQAPTRGPERVDLVDLADNTAADITDEAGEITWEGLDGSWSPELIDFLDGDADATPEVPGWTYASTVSADEGRAPAPLTITVDSAAPSVQATVTEISPAEGVEIDVAGTGFRAETNPGDMGIYVGLAEAGEFPDTSSFDTSAFADAAWIMPAQMADGDWTTVLNAATEDLDPTKEYALYTWQAHTHSNDSQNTTTPVEIDFSKLQAPRQATKVRASVAKKPTPKKAGKLRVAVTNDGPGKVSGAVKVKLTKIKGKGTKTVSSQIRRGATTVRVPKLGKARWKAVVRYTGSPSFKASADVIRFRVR